MSMICKYLIGVAVIATLGGTGYRASDRFNFQSRVSDDRAALAELMWMDRAAVASGERPGAKPPTPVPAHSRELSGSELYEVSCSACHGPKGGGVEGLVPPLAGNATLASGEPEYLIQTICNGVRAEESRTGAGMPPFNQKLSNGQIAALSTYVRDVAGNTDSPIDAENAACERRASTPGEE
ncbi:c-type cytochrome [Sinorhizobium meliloti]|uniref:c-type cytochrome n=1 Tax=Rhizobium meliloti TaxID=382 RepID=UPI0004831FA4|nr:cytochrome c [Sinorhizobium meliloti]